MKYTITIEDELGNEGAFYITSYLLTDTDERVRDTLLGGYLRERIVHLTATAGYTLESVNDRNEVRHRET